MSDGQKITLAILAGGRGSRMGKPKALLEVRGKPILTYLLDRLAWNGPKWLITAPGMERPPGAQSFDRELVDPEEGAGPLRGVLTALEHLETEFLLVLTVDMPAVTQTLTDPLLQHLSQDPSLLGAMYAHKTTGICEPFPLALRATALNVVRTRFAQGHRSVQGLLELPAFVAIPAPENDVWTNLNTPADLKSWLPNDPVP